MKTKTTILFLSINLFLSSCASYRYSAEKQENNTVSITSDNVKNFSLNSASVSGPIGQSSGGKLIYTFKSLDKNNLKFNLSHPNYNDVEIEFERQVRPNALSKDIALGIFTIGIPLIYDAFNSDFYRIKPSGKNIAIHFEFKQTFMREEFNKIKKSNDPKTFQNWLDQYQNSDILKTVENHKDSLELTIAISQQSEKAIDQYISTHPNSKSLSNATKIKSEMVSARELYEKALTSNSTEAFENYLKEYPSSLNNYDAHRLLTKSAEKRAIESQDISALVLYIKNYLEPNSSYFNSSEVQAMKELVSSKIDNLLINEYVQQKSGDLYNTYSQLWTRYNSIKIEVPQNYLLELKEVLKCRNTIYPLLFNQLKGIKTKQDQTNLVNKFNKDFPNLTPLASDDLIITVINQTPNAQGNIRLFDLSYVSEYMKKLPKGDNLLNKNTYVYKNNTFVAFENISLEELTFLDGKFNGTCKFFNANEIKTSLTFVNKLITEISYFQNGSLVKTIYFDSSNKSYEYEFENNINLSLLELDKKIKAGKELLITNNYYEAELYFQGALKNNFPITVSQNVELKKLFDTTKTKRLAQEKKQEEIRLAEEKKKELKRIADEKIVRNITSADFEDNSGQMIGQNITVSGWYTEYDQKDWGGLYNVDNMTLRMHFFGQGVNEELYAATVFQYRRESSDNYCRIVKIGTKEVTLVIPKSISNNLPNTESDFIKITGKVLSYNTIQVRSITRDN